MTEPTLPYATRSAPLPGLTIVVADDQVTLTKTPPHGVMLGTLITMTVLLAAIWTAFGYAAVRFVVSARSWGGLSYILWGFAMMAMPAFPALLCTIGTAVGWWRYWRVGPVPLEVRITRDGLFISGAGNLRAVSSSHFAPDAVRSIRLGPVRGALARKPLCEIIIRVRWRFPLVVRTSEPIDGPPRAFVDGANRLLNLRH